MVLMVPAVAVNVLVLAPAAIDNEAGTVSCALSLERFTMTPPAGAAWDRVTVHVDDAPLLNEVRVQLTELTTIWFTNDKLAVTELPL